MNTEKGWARWIRSLLSTVKSLRGEIRYASEIAQKCGEILALQG